MSILKINNNINFSKFGSRHILQSMPSFKNNAEINHNEAFNKKSDDDLYFWSSIEPDTRFNKISKNMIKTLALGIPLADIAASTFVKRGNLSAKLNKAAKTSFVWAGAFVAASAVTSVKNFVNSYSEFAENFNKKHPFISTIVDFSAIYAVFVGFLNAAANIKNSIKTAFPKSVSNLNTTFIKPVKTLINKSFINKKLVLPLEYSINKRSQMVNATKFAASLVVPAMLTGALLRYINEAKHREQSIEKNYNFLKSMNNNIEENYLD